MNCEIIMRTVKKNREVYNRFLKYLLYASLALLVFNIIYLQNSLIVFWINNNMKYGSASFDSVTRDNYISESEIDFRSILIRPEDIRKSGSNIFFIETTCCTRSGQIRKKPKMNAINLNVRQACAIESAANLNRDSMVLILYSCPIDEYMLRSTPKEIIQIFRYTNVKIVMFEMHEYFEGSPVDDLYVKGTMETSKFPVEHTSDVLRFLTLWKYGGTYIDLDVICLRSLDMLGTNFAGYELKNAIGTAIINFQETGIGLTLLTQILNHLNKKFDLNNWSHNGPNLLTKTLFKLCNNVQIIEEHDRRICDGFTMFKQKTFYPIPWNQWRSFFNTTSSNKTLKLMKNSYAVHLWNKHTHKVKVFVDSEQPFDILASQYCQLVHSQIKRNYFVVF